MNVPKRQAKQIRAFLDWEKPDDVEASVTVIHGDGYITVAFIYQGIHGHRDIPPCISPADIPGVLSTIVVGFQKQVHAIRGPSAGSSGCSPLFGFDYSMN